MIVHIFFNDTRKESTSVCSISHVAFLVKPGGTKPAIEGFKRWDSQTDAALIGVLEEISPMTAAQNTKKGKWIAVANAFCPTGPRPKTLQNRWKDLGETYKNSEKSRSGTGSGAPPRTPLEERIRILLEKVANHKSLQAGPTPKVILIFSNYHLK